MDEVAERVEDVGREVREFLAQELGGEPADYEWTGPVPHLDELSTYRVCSCGNLEFWVRVEESLDTYFLVCTACGDDIEMRGREVEKDE